MSVRYLYIIMSKGATKERSLLTEVFYSLWDSITKKTKDDTSTLASFNFLQVLILTQKISFLISLRRSWKNLCITETISYSPHRRRPSSLQFHWHCESKIYGQIEIRNKKLQWEPRACYQPSDMHPTFIYPVHLLTYHAHHSRMRTMKEGEANNREKGDDGLHFVIKA